MSRQPRNGFTLVELLIALAVMSTVYAMAAPGVEQMFERTRATAGVNRLVGAVNLTRHTAVQFGRMATLCGLRPDGRCGADWGGRLTLFLDLNQNARLEEEDQVINTIAPASASTSVRWRAFQNKQYLQMTPMGYTNYQNGNFVICSKADDIANARQLIVNIQGRTRLNHRTNADDLPIDRKGRLLRC